MNPAEFETVRQTPSTHPLLTAANLVNKRPRTLLYGHFSHGPKLHVYLDEKGMIHRFTYVLAEPGGQPGVEGLPLKLSHTKGISGGVPYNNWFAPDVLMGRTYPESSDFEFLMLLRQAGVPLSFGEFQEVPEPGRCTPRATGKGSRAFTGLRDTDEFVHTVELSQQIRVELHLNADQLAEAVDLRIQQLACEKLQVRHFFDDPGEFVLVDSSRAEQVVSECASISATLPKTWMPEWELLDSAYRQAFGPNAPACRLTPKRQVGAVAVFASVFSSQFTPVSNESQVLQPVSSSNGLLQGLVGQCEGQAFAAVLKEGRHSPEKYEMELIVEQFGEPGQAIGQFLTQHGLKVPEAVVL